MAPVVLIASLIVVDAVLGGQSPSAVRSVAAILVWWGILVAVAFDLAPRAAVPRAALACTGLLVLFGLFTALSIGWAPSAERAFSEADRVLLYAGVLLLSVLLARRGDAGRWVDGMALAVVAVAALALGQRLFPGLLPDDQLAEQLPNAATRLSYPVGYWNGLAIFVALGVPLLLRAAVVARSPLWRAAAVAPLPMIAGVIYLTSSRGGVAVAVAGGAAFAILLGRVRAILALAIGAVGSVLSVAILEARPTLVDGPFASAAAKDAGLEAALLIAGICLACALLYALISLRVALRPALPKLVWPLLAVVVIAGVIAADPAARVRTFKAEPAVQQAPGAPAIGGHLSSGGGSGRWQFWSAAADQWKEHPLAGDGAGSFEPWWAQHGTLDWFVRNAHSLWLETLGELGVIGFLLLAGVFGVGIATGLGRLRGRVEQDRATVAALLAVLLGFVLGAAIDWIWQLPAIAALALLSLGLLTGPATTPEDRRERSPGFGFGPRVALVLAAWIAICAQALPFLASEEVGASQRAAARGELGKALDHARSAKAIQPWAASPRVQLALVREEAGQIGPARRDITAGIVRDESDWRLQVVAARLAIRAGDVPGARRALARARALNPRSRLLRSAVGAQKGR
ncbi:MAG TPA: O-antigen ligase family protein [Thermoleophilaceae bacterium]|nr:O-antigen ligase family protein [Thermoleophilaceae bacterium]